MKRPRLIQVITAIFAICYTLLIQPEAKTAEDRPNFVIVLADDVSWSSFGCMDSGLQTHTPNIDRLATEGIRFSSFYAAASQCTPVRHELYTGLLPSNSGVYANGNKPKGTFDNVVNFLGDLGYEVGLAGKVHFKSETVFKKIKGFTVGCNSPTPTWELDGLKDFIQSSRSVDKPFCAVIASVHAHHPWTIGDTSRIPANTLTLPPHMVDTPTTRESIARHAAEVGDLDNQVGAVMNMLTEMQLEKDTVLIFLSEQGTAMPNGKWSIFDYGCRALCIARWPGHIATNTTTSARAMYCDIVPTLVDLAGGEAPAVDGRSLRGVLDGSTNEHRKYAFLYNTTPISQRAIVGSDYKLIWTPDRSMDYEMVNSGDPSKLFAKAWGEWVEKAETDPSAKAKLEHVTKHPEFALYHLSKDPWELTDLAPNAEYDSRVKTLFADLQAEMETYNDSWDPNKTTSKKSGGKKGKK
jgi:N-sulfoglucosamine sulfohydrolase